MNDPIVSVICITYNHEKYIRQCLDGFLMQKDVSFEILIHDDASTDCTADIIREYERKYPSIIKPIYQTENQYSKGIRIVHTFLYPRAKGKYVALCEGDDYWTDPYKLKKQVTALDTHKECLISVHGTCCINVYGELVRKNYARKELPNGVIQSDILVDIEMHAHSFHTSSYFIRKSAVDDYYLNLPDYVQYYGDEDFPMLLYYGSKGTVYVMNEVMSAYRIGTPGSITNKANLYTNNQKIEKKQKCKKMVQMFNEYTEQKYAESCNLRVALTEFEIRSILEPKLAVFSPKNIRFLRYYGKKYILSLYLKALFPKLFGFVLRKHYERRENKV